MVIIRWIRNRIGLANSDNNSDTGDEQVSVNRRKVLKGAVATSGVGAVPMSVSAESPSNLTMTPVERNSAFEDIFGDSRNGSSITLSDSQQNHLGEYIRDQASELIYRLEDKGVFDVASIDAEDLLSGQAFESTKFDLDKPESGIVLGYRSRLGEERTKIQYTLHQPSELGYFEDETRISIIITPGEKRAYALIEPLSQVSGTKNNSIIRHISNKQESPVNSEDQIHKIDEYDVVTQGSIFTYCYNPTSGQPIRARVYCQAGSCSQTVIGTCSPPVSRRWPRCQRYYIDGCWYYDTPCPQGEDRAKC
ncbi:hypothetical protein [Salarchaeum japonicum]|uniref:Twin-arginine translocation signal domain-containing protein n=1 Tax=Salarchaeum japonicum TaxID=555573 RepID=A0AAV3SY60_9EURY|nr:hypothetical protein [Salarchaeum japonicum]